MNAELKAAELAAPSRIALNRAVVILTLMTAGEGIFLLPFIVARIFRPTLLDVFGLTKLQLGAAFSVYGMLALVSYLLGGPLADRFAARRLMTAALVSTALGGILFARAPSLGVLTLLYGYWGLTTTLLFWAALMRATREWGGSTGQGRAFGLLEGGRGLLSALLASVSVALFAALLPTDAASATLAQRSAALIKIIWIFTGICLGLAALVWVLVPEPEPKPEPMPKPNDDSGAARKLTLAGVRRCVRMPALWLQATILACAYVSFKGIDDFALYARDAFGYNDVAAAQISTLSFWVRPFAALGAGLLADCTNASRMIVLSFAILIVGSLTIALGGIQPGRHWMLVTTVAGTSVGIYAVRGVYFALLQEAHVPLAITGSAVGFVSVLGYTPDIFIPALIGYLIDRTPGALGHQHVFGMLATFATMGLLATLLFQKVTRKGRSDRKQ